LSKCPTLAGITAVVLEYHVFQNVSLIPEKVGIAEQLGVFLGELIVGLILSREVRSPPLNSTVRPQLARMLDPSTGRQEIPEMSFGCPQSVGPF
jgi:hypothetical protein